MPGADQEMIKEARAVASLVGVDVDKLNGSKRRLGMAINKMVVAEVVMHYTRIDEMLAEIIIRYFFNLELDEVHFAGAWQSERSRIFVHHVLDEMFLLKKLGVAHATKPVPNKVTKIINRVNAVRNGLAHSFFPENRKENRASGKVLYRQHDVRSSEGLAKFQNDAETAYRYLETYVYGPIS
jgi:hypothetical protein